MKATIKSWNLSVTWSDGVTERLTADLPEYLQDELRIYFKELEDLREEHDAGLRDEAYNFGETAGVAAYFESPTGAHEVATFCDEETYAACVPALEALAKAQGYVLTEGESK
jgi:hypothetical protein